MKRKFFWSSVVTVIAIIALAFSHFVLGISPFYKGKILPPQTENRPGLTIAPNFELPNIEGQNFRLSDHKGEIIVIDFWTTWCPPCVRSMPELNELFTRYKESGLEVVGINLGENVDKTVRPYIQQKGIQYQILTGNRWSQVTKAFGRYNLPWAFVIDQDGYIRKEFRGYTPQQKFEDEILKLLKTR